MEIYAIIISRVNSACDKNSLCWLIQINIFATVAIRILARSRCNSNYILTNVIVPRGTGIFDNSGAIIRNGFRSFLNSGSRFISCPHLLWNRRSLPIIRESRASRPGKFPASSGGNNVTGCRWVSFPTYSQVVVSRPASLISHRRSGCHRCSTTIFSLSLFRPLSFPLSSISFYTIVVYLIVDFPSICSLRIFLYLPAHYGILYRSAVSGVRVDRGLSVRYFDRLGRMGKGVSV